MFVIQIPTVFDIYKCIMIHITGPKQDRGFRVCPTGKSHINFHFFTCLLTDWFAQKNADNKVIFVTIFITATNQVRSITHNIVPLQSGSVFYERT